MVADLFEPVVSDDRLSAKFKELALSRGFAPARATLRDVFGRMGRRDANFIEQFQTSGFDARVSELYLFAAFEAAGFDIEFVGDAPDFLLCGHGCDWAVEATTANPSNGIPPALPDDADELQRYIYGELVVRLGSALFSKLKRRYWEQAHVVGKPLVIAIQNFASEDAQQLGDTALVAYLYGRLTAGSLDPDGRLQVTNSEIASHIGSSKTIPSHFFGLPDAEHVAAVLWTNSGTVPKFARMGFQRGMDSAGIRMARVGQRFVMDPNADQPAAFTYEVGSRWESWEEGLVMAHNPRATIPLPEGAFPGIVHHALRPDGLIASTMPPFHAFASRTAIVVGI